MNQPIIYAVLAMACYGLSDFIYKRAAGAGIRPEHFLMAQAWFFCPTVIVYALATHTLIVHSAALWGLLAGIFYFVGFFCFILSLAAGSVSTNASIFRLNFIVTVMLAIALLGEPLTIIKLIGLALALLATWLLVGGGTAKDLAFQSAQRRSLIQVAIATVAFGAATFFQTLGLRQGANPETLAVAQAASFMPLATFVVYRAHGTLRLPAVTFKYAIAAAIMLLSATLFLLRGLVTGQASVLVPIAQMGFIVAALLGVFVLRERVTRRKAVGLIAAMAALGVLASS